MSCLFKKHLYARPDKAEKWRYEKRDYNERPANYSSCILASVGGFPQVVVYLENTASGLDPNSFVTSTFAFFAISASRSS